MKEKSPCLCCAFQDECVRWITPNVGCSEARRCREGSEEEKKCEGSGEITGLLWWAVTFKVKVIKAECKIAEAGTCRPTWVTISTILTRRTAEEGLLQSSQQKKPSQSLVLNRQIIYQWPESSGMDESLSQHNILENFRGSSIVDQSAVPTPLRATKSIISREGKKSEKPKAALLWVLAGFEWMAVWVWAVGSGRAFPLREWECLVLLGSDWMGKEGTE